jgi:hypothetical protein
MQAKTIQLYGTMKDINEYSQIKIELDDISFKKLKNSINQARNSGTTVEGANNASMPKVPFYTTTFVDTDGVETSRFYVKVNIPKWMQKDTAKFYTKKGKEVKVQCMSNSYDFQMADGTNVQGMNLILVSLN